MYVPPYVPQQIEIAGNVAEEKYLVRLGFIRRVTVFHFLSVLIVACVTLAPIGPVPPFSAGVSVLALLVLLTMIRGMAKGRDAERRFSVALLPLLLLALGLWLRALGEQGWAVWALGVGAFWVLVYTALCGRDLSFVGMFVMAWLASLLTIAVLCWQLRISTVTTLSALSLNSMFLFYHVYDLAALQTRRRLGEEWGAVVDLYRDVLNGVAYPIRVVHHWRKHNIWTPPKEWFR